MKDDYKFPEKQSSDAEEMFNWINQALCAILKRVLRIDFWVSEACGGERGAQSG